MSGLYISVGSIEEARRAASALSFVPTARQITMTAGPLAIAVTRVDALELWGPARDPQTGVQVALGGRIAFDEREWAAGEKLPYEGGLACRIVLDRFLRHQGSLAERLNGAGVIVIADPGKNDLHVFTDRLGMVPMFEWDAAEPILCSHPDALATLMAGRGKSAEFDPLTAAEFLGTGSAVQPFTYYRQIRMLEPASHYQWELDGANWKRRRTTHWQPAYLTEEPSRDADQMTGRLADALHRAVRRRTLTRLGRPAVLLSGGADSRTVAFGAEDPTQVVCFTLFDEPNEELKTAHRIAVAAGAQHVPLQRDTDYYARNAEESVRISGGMWSLVDTHYTGMIPQLSAQGIGSLLTGCYADYMFKGLMFNRQFRLLFGRALPLYDFAPFDFSFYIQKAPLRAAWQERVRERQCHRFPQALRNGDDGARLAIEDLRLRPLAREADVAGRSILLRTLPWDHLLSDTDILRVYERMSAELKLNGIVFGRAVAELCGPAGRAIPNNNYRTPVGASETERALWFLAAVLKRKVRRALGTERKRGGAVTTGSWPEWSYYLAHSPAVTQLWSEPKSSERELFTDWLGQDPWSLSQHDWARQDALQFARLLTLRIWLRERRIS